MTTSGSVVLGLGNVLLSDEGVGVRAIQRLLADPRVPPNVTLVDGGTLGLELLSYAADAARLLILDAVDVGAPAGELVRLEADALRGIGGGASVHQLGAADLLAAMYLTGNAPADLVLLGIQPATTQLSVDLSPAVEAALGPLVEAAVAELTTWEDQRVCMRLD